MSLCTLGRFNFSFFSKVEGSMGRKIAKWRQMNVLKNGVSNLTLTSAPFWFKISKFTWKSKKKCFLSLIICYESVIIDHNETNQTIFANLLLFGRFQILRKNSKNHVFWNSYQKNIWKKCISLFFILSVLSILNRI